MIDDETDPLYTSRPAAIEAAAAFIAIDETVFFTRGLLSAAGTTIWLTRAGRVTGAFEGVEETSDFVLSVVTGVVKGWFVGLLAVVFTSRWRSWADAVEPKTKLMNNAINDRYEIFFKFFKT
jgi:hypothetical protein